MPDPFYSFTSPPHHVSIMSIVSESLFEAPSSRAQTGSLPFRRRLWVSRRCRSLLFVPLFPWTS